MRRLLALLTLLAGAPALAQEMPCGPDAPCEIETGSYHLVVPAGWDGEAPLPALIFYHGHRGSGAQVFRSQGLRESFADAGYLLIAPNGVRPEGQDYFTNPAREGAPRDEVAFTLAILDDVAARLPLDRARVFASGFSAGGSMAWLMACEAGEHLAGMVSVAGALRRPNPTGCAGLEGLPVMQVHGFADAQVPFEGRAIRDWHQGSVWEALARARERNGCRSNPDEITLTEGFRLRDWDASCSGGRVRLALHDGGHGLPRGWTELARRFLEGG
ncbi:alpha/beta hydrolase family esterase [Jannaschia marina]|uniref:alpha/beta hydrolase family esterase n=1 Tax=Jannaschia marina TaxID=2741674 RepID=UPI0015C931A4|nr:polyhydroxybutyrate depolymerase [Jannaschia marina]